MNPSVRTVLVAAATLLAAGVDLRAEQAAAPAGSGQLAELARAAKEQEFTGNAETGWELFRQKNCMRCHAVWGEGGEVGPDLGRIRVFEHVTAGQLAAMMWNHVPRMWEKMEEGGIQLTPISPQEMSDLFAFLLFIRYADEPGDPAEGKRLLAQHGCETCHAIDARGGKIGPDLAKWARFVNPIVWAQKMWAHAPEMKAKMNAMGIAWPRFSGEDLNNIVAFIRSRAGGEVKEYIQPGSAARGRKLFETHGCVACHSPAGTAGVGADLLEAKLADSLSGIASDMWNHAPKMQQEMREKGTGLADLSPQDMADVITYLLTRRYYRGEGDAEAGRAVFFSKQCVVCHSIGAGGGGGAPNLAAIQGNASPILMAHVMWRYGPAMLGQMADRGIRWPHFDGDEMGNLIAFLNSESRKATPAADRP